jgi:hypothetical protein
MSVNVAARRAEDKRYEQQLEREINELQQALYAKQVALERLLRESEYLRPEKGHP